MTSTTASTGVVNTSGTTSYITGTASGLDTASLIKAAVAQKTAAADTLDAKVTANTTKISAYQTLQGLISGLSTAISGLASGTYSSVSTSTNAFQAKSVSLTSSDSSTASDYLAVSAASTAVATASTVTVDQLATAQKVASATQTNTGALGYNGTFTLGQGTATPQTVTVNPTMSLADIAAAINAVSSASGVSASMIQVEPGSYRLLLSANATNQPITAATASGDDVLGSLGVTDSTGAFADVLQTAQPSLVTIDGNQIKSDTNNVTDAVTGLSMSLLKTTPSGMTLNMSVQPDYSGVKTAITNFITAYNSLRDFVNTNQAVGADGTAASGATLFADPLLRSASQTLNSLLFSDHSNAGTLSNLADLGITLDTNNKLSLSNETTLDNALLGNLSDVSNLFQSSFTPSNSALKLLANNTTGAFHFTLDVTANSDGTITGASVGGDSSLFTVSGSRIVGAAGGPYAGLSFALVANANTSISVDIQPGLANQMTAYASTYADGNTGLLQQQIAALTSQDNDWSSRSSQIRSDAATYQSNLVTRYANMEQEVSAAQLVQAQIKAILQGSSTNG